ncbi:hypothetical protein RAC89_01085 [Paenibacillus sp. GD4]|uniref:hypothetical protein n=1 Tax=Paenibacillus sp. GD4 TaxID=3068890 RepID=UPI0027967A87|nr:hypothetical protein [Paenibacillus sp. GD4]MDQ1909091.1 hypothetical protein [Paenibacillus sp. GD4]
MASSAEAVQKDVYQEEAVSSLIMEEVTQCLKQSTKEELLELMDALQVIRDYLQECH